MSARSAPRAPRELPPLDLPTDYLSEDEEDDAADTQHPFYNAGQQTVERMLAFAFEDRQAARRKPSDRQDAAGAPGTRQRRQAWWALYCCFVHIMGGDLSKPPDGETLCRFLRHVVRRIRSSRLERDAPSKLYVLGGIRALCKRFVLEYKDFALSAHDLAILDADMAQLVKEGALLVGVARDKQWVGLILVRKMITDWITRALDDGAINWDVVLSRALGVALQYCLDCRSGEVVRSRDYKGEEYLKWSDIRMKMVDGANFEHLVTEIHVRWEKGSKDDPTKYRIIYLRPFSDLINALADPIALLLIMAMRSGQTAAKNLNEALALIEMSPHRTLEWQSPDRPVLAKIINSPTRQLEFHSPAATSQALASVKLLAEAGGITEPLVTHDLRRGSVRDNSRVKDLDAGISPRVGAAAGHTAAATARGITDAYAGRISIGLPNQREAVVEETSTLASFGIVPVSEPRPSRRRAGMIERQELKAKVDLSSGTNHAGRAFTPAVVNLRINRRVDEDWRKAASLMTATIEGHLEVAEAIRGHVTSSLTRLSEHIERGPRLDIGASLLSPADLSHGSRYEDVLEPFPWDGCDSSGYDAVDDLALVGYDAVDDLALVGAIAQDDHGDAACPPSPMYVAEDLPALPLSATYDEVEDGWPWDEIDGDAEDDGTFPELWSYMTDGDFTPGEHLDEWYGGLATEALAQDGMSSSVAAAAPSVPELINFLARINVVIYTPKPKTSAELIARGHVHGNSRDMPHQFVKACRYVAFGCTKAPYHHRNKLQVHEKVCYFRPDASPDERALAAAAEANPPKKKSSARSKPRSDARLIVSLACPRKDVCGSKRVYKLIGQLRSHLMRVHSLSREQQDEILNREANLTSRRNFPFSENQSCPLGRCGAVKTFGTRQALQKHLTKRPHCLSVADARAIAGYSGPTKAAEAIREALARQDPASDEVDKSFYCPIQGCPRAGVPLSSKDSVTKHLTSKHGFTTEAAREKMGYGARRVVKRKGGSE